MLALRKSSLMRLSNLILISSGRYFLPTPTRRSPVVSVIKDYPAAKVHPSDILCLNIPGPSNVAVRAYSAWQQSNVVDGILKKEFRKACDCCIGGWVRSGAGVEDQDHGFFVRSGVKRGIARRFVGDINGWAKRYESAIL
jgi:hypothetical protein